MNANSVDDDGEVSYMASAFNSDEEDLPSEHGVSNAVSQGVAGKKQLTLMAFAGFNKHETPEQQAACHQREGLKDAEARMQREEEEHIMEDCAAMKKKANARERQWCHRARKKADTQTTAPPGGRLWRIGSGQQTVTKGTLISATDQRSVTSACMLEVAAD